MDVYFSFLGAVAPLDLPMSVCLSDTLFSNMIFKPPPTPPDHPQTFHYPLPSSPIYQPTFQTLPEPLQTHYNLQNIEYN